MRVKLKKSFPKVFCSVHSPLQQWDIQILLYHEKSKSVIATLRVHQSCKFVFFNLFLQLIELQYLRALSLLAYH